MLSLFECKLSKDKDPIALKSEMESLWYASVLPCAHINDRHWYALPLNPNWAKKSFSIKGSRLILSID